MAQELPHASGVAIKIKKKILLIKKKITFFWTTLKKHVEVPGPGIEPTPQHQPELLQ